MKGIPKQISTILKDPERKVTDIPGIGKGIAAVLEEIEQRGSFERRDEMLEKYPGRRAGAVEDPGTGAEKHPPAV